MCVYRALYVVVPVCTSSWMFVVFESVRICLVVLKVVFKYSWRICSVVI